MRRLIITLWVPMILSTLALFYAVGGWRLALGGFLMLVTIRLELRMERLKADARIQKLVDDENAKYD